MKKITRNKKVIRLGTVVIALMMAAAFTVLDTPEAFGEDQGIHAQTVATSSTVRPGNNTVTLTGCVKGKEYVLAVVKGSYSSHAIAADTVLFIDQKTAQGSTLEFSFVINTSDRCVILVSSNDGASNYPIVMGEVNIPISEATVSLAAKTYNGKTQAASVSSIKYRSITLKSGTDYSISGSGVKAGTYTATITGKGRFSGTAKKSFKINPLALSKTTATVTSKTYTGKTQAPTVSIRYGGSALKKGTDFTVTGSGKNVGTYTVKMTGKGNFTGTVSKSFKIKPVGTKLKSLKKGKKSMTVKWYQPNKKYKSQMTGYQIQYSLYASFKNAKIVSGGGYAKTSKTIKGLKAKKKYYVRIRTYKNGCYSSWSKAKNVTTK